MTIAAPTPEALATLDRPIRVLLVDDHASVRSSLRLLLERQADVEVVGEAGDGAAAAQVAEHVDADVVLMDLSMPGVDGIEGTRRVLAARPSAHVVVLTTFADHDRILGALDAGAVGYLLKDVAPPELFAAIRAAARGESPLDPRAASALIASRVPRGASADLSPREREVLQLVAGGLANKVIARRLEISEKTVKTHLTNVFQRIGVADRTQAALWARRHGLGPA